VSAEDLTRKGIAAHKAGDATDAARLLAQAVQANPTYEMAWLWLASSLIVPGERRYCLERALTINPQSQPARQGLAALGDTAPVVPAVLAGSEPIEPPPDLAGSTGPVPAKKRRMSPLAFVGLVVGGLVVLCVFLNVTGLGLSLLSAVAGPLEGEEARLVTGAPRVIVGRTQEALNAAGAVTVAELSELEQNGQVFVVANRTRVRVITLGAPYTLIQILDGEHAGSRGYVPTGFVQ
jgi:hypothetical protein